MDTLPEMTRRELTWHETIAAKRARKAAEAAGCPPESRQALAFSAAAEAGQLQISGIAVPPITLGTLWAVEEGDVHLDVLTGGKRYADLSLLCATLLTPEKTLLDLLAGDLPAVQTAMLEAAERLTPDQALALDRWFGDEMARLRALTGGATAAEPGKSSDAPNL